MGDGNERCPSPLRHHHAAAAAEASARARLHLQLLHLGRVRYLPSLLPSFLPSPPFLGPRGPTRGTRVAYVICKKGSHFTLYTYLIVPLPQLPLSAHNRYSRCEDPFVYLIALKLLKIKMILIFVKSTV